MKLIWTKSNLPLSVLIQWFSQEPCSHFAIVFDDSLVFHSNLFGVHLEWYSHYKKSTTIVFEKDIPMSLEDEERLYRAIVDEHYGKPYDYKALLYFGWRMTLKRFFGTPLPTRNDWQTPESFLCTGLAKSLGEVFPMELDYEMVSPYALWRLCGKTDL